MRAEIVSIGDELLKGQRVNTNAAFISRALATIGIAVDRVTACSDRVEDIVAVLGESLHRTDVVLVTGGLGPTRDDCTKKAVQQLLQRELVVHEESYCLLVERLAKYGRAVSPQLCDQATVLEGSQAIVNPKGTAAGMLIACGEQFEHHSLVIMPGVPVEMIAMMEQSVLPLFAERSDSVVRHTPVKTLGVGESLLAEQLTEVEDRLPEGTTLAYLPYAAGVDLMVSTFGRIRYEVERDNKKVVDAILQKVGHLVYTTDERKLEEVIGSMLLQQGVTVAVAESCTGGLVASRLTDVAGSSAYFLQGFVTYSNEAKQKLLGVPEETLIAFGAVSEETARAMALGCLQASGADFALATTGIAGPGGGTPEKPVGTLCMAVAGKNMPNIISKRIVAHGDREQNKLRFSTAILRELWECLHF